MTMPMNNNITPAVAIILQSFVYLSRLITYKISDMANVSGSEAIKYVVGGVRIDEDDP